METKQRKLLFWEGSSKKDFKAFPESVQIALIESRLKAVLARHKRSRE